VQVPWPQKQIMVGSTKCIHWKISRNFLEPWSVSFSFNLLELAKTNSNFYSIILNLFTDYHLSQCLGELMCRLPTIQQEVQQRKLLYMGMYLLICGEAANLRFMPECLWYIYHHVRSILQITLVVIYSLFLFFGQCYVNIKFLVANFPKGPHYEGSWVAWHIIFVLQCFAKFNP
jgi:hypothetical protein